MKSKLFSMPKTVYRLAVFFVLAALLPGCSFGNLPTPAAATVDPRPTFEAIQTQSAQTVVAELTRNAPQVQPAQPTATQVVITATQVLPTDTAVPTVIPSFTAVPPTPTFTRVPPTLPPAATNTPVNVGCKITDQSPAFGDDFPKEADFDGRWVVKNTSTSAWASSAVDVKYISGTKFQTKVDIFDLKSDVAVDGSITIVVDMLTPKTNGRYSTTWALVQGGTTLCTLGITLDVNK
jgi:hypothetical protein